MLLVKLDDCAFELSYFVAVEGEENGTLSDPKVRAKIRLDNQMTICTHASVQEVTRALQRPILIDEERLEKDPDGYGE